MFRTEHAISRKNYAVLKIAQQNERKTEMNENPEN